MTEWCSLWVAENISWDRDLVGTASKSCRRVALLLLMRACDTWYFYSVVSPLALVCVRPFSPPWQLDDTDEENDDERIRHDGVVHRGGGLSDGDAPAVAAGAFSSAAPLSSATAAGGRYSPKVSQELQDGSDGTVTSEQAAAGDLFGTPRPAATAPSSAAVIVDSDATQTIQGEAQHSQNLIGGGNTTRAGIGVGPTGSGVVTQANDDIEAEATTGPMEPGWSLAETQQQSLPSPHTSQPACARPADGAGGERVGVGGGSTSTAGLEGDGGGAGDCQLLWKWEQMGAQDQYLDLSFNESVEGEEEGEPMGGGGDEGAEKRRYAGDAVDAIATSSRVSAL